MLASDLNNPEFVNPQNPDQFLAVDIYWAEPLDKNKTEKASEDAGKYVPVKEPKQIFIRIQKPGDLTSVIETRLREDHKRRFPDHWKRFQIVEGLLNEDIPGWKVDEWGELSQDEINRLKFLRFNTVEQIAAASDAQCQGIGMGAEGLRMRARIAIRDRAKNMVKDELAQKDKEIAEMKARMERLEAALLQNAAPQGSANGNAVASAPRYDVIAPAEAAPKKRGGRPKGSKNKPKQEGANV